MTQQKEAYKRKSYTNLSIDIFKKLLAYFCLISYYDQKHQFTDSEVREYISKSIKMVNQEIDPEAFLRDLQESVCILQREGLYWIFSHRSFQEYFSAYCLAFLVSNRMKDIFPHIISRLQDTVFPMCLDMNSHAVEAEYVIPTLEGFVEKFSIQDKSEIASNYVIAYDCAIFAHATPLGRGGYSGRLLLHSYQPAWLALAVFARNFGVKQSKPSTKSLKKEDNLVKNILRVDMEKARSELYIVRFREQHLQRTASWASGGADVDTTVDSDIEIGRPGFTKSISFEEIKGTVLESNIFEQIKVMDELCKKLKKKREDRTKSIEEIFSF